MLIFGTKSTRKLLDKGTFNCPQCSNTTEFEKRRARSWFHLYFIPLIPYKTHPNYVECKGCKATFVENVLSANSQADSSQIRAEFEIGTLAILARMAWADGVVDDSEVEAIYEVANQIAAQEFSRDDINIALAEAKDSLEDALAVATRIGNVVNDDGKELILQAVYMVAAADGDFAQEERDMILEVGAGLGLRPAHVRGVLSELAERSSDQHNSMS